MTRSRELTFDNILKIVGETSVSEHRTEEFYAVAQLLALGELTNDQQKQLGKTLAEMIEQDNWWRSNGAFRDE